MNVPERIDFIRQHLIDPEVCIRCNTCEETCPVVPGLEREDWPLADPKGQSLEAVRAIRDEIQRRVTAMLAERGLGRK